MFSRKQKEIDRLNARCVELARMIRKLKNENSDLRCEIDEVTDIIKRINLLMTCNQYNNNETLKRKIIELTSDYQSIC